MRTAHDEVRVELIRETGYTYRQPQTGIGVVGRSIEILVVERVDEGQTFGVGTESVNEVLTRLVEITTAVRHPFDTRYHQTVRPVAVTQVRTVVGRVLHRPKALLAVLILRFRTEVIMEIILQTIPSGGIDTFLGILEYFCQIVTVDLRHLVRSGIVLTVCLVQIYFR